MKDDDKAKEQLLNELVEMRNRIAELEKSESELKQAEKKLRKSQEHAQLLADVLEKSSQPFAVGYPDGRLITYNTAYCKLTGYNKEELRKVKWSTALTPPEWREVVAKAAEKILHTGQPQRFEKEYIRKDGSRVSVEVLAHPIFDSKGNLEYFHSFFTDITDRKQAEEELKKHRDHLEELVEERTAELKKINEQLQREIAERKRTENILWVSHNFLEIAYRYTEMTPLLKEFVAEVQNLTDCAAVGIRILDEEGNIPYQAYEGFSQRFYQSESPLSINSDQCMCINVIKGRVNPKLLFYTEGGSFYMNGTTRFLAMVSEEEKGQTRNVCNEFGYESVALVPIRFRDSILGLIHVADPQENMVPLDIVELLEGTAMQLGTAIQKVRAEEELRNSREQLRNLSAYLQSVREKERTHISQEIHDELGQILTALKMDLSWMDNKLPKEQKLLIEKTKSMAKLIDTTIHTVQRISAELRPGVLDDLGLVAAIEWQAEEFKNRTGIKFGISLEPVDIALDKERSTAIFRILQETLTNVARHAKATRVKVSLKEKAGQLVLKVRDNGKGITEKQISDPKSFGLIGIRERAHFWGGKVKISGVPDKGTTVTVSIPLHKKGDTDDKNTHR